jgi:hypothetical protein
MTTSRLAPLFSTGLRRTAVGGAIGFAVGLASGVLTMGFSGVDLSVAPVVKIVATLAAGATAAGAFSANFGFYYIKFLTRDLYRTKPPLCYDDLDALWGLQPLPVPRVVDPLWDRFLDGPLPPGTVDPGGSDL